MCVIHYVFKITYKYLIKIHKITKEPILPLPLAK